MKKKNLALLLVFTGTLLTSCTSGQNSWTVIQYPTCQTPGIEQTQVFGFLRTREIPAIDHDWSEPIIVKAPSHTEEGKKVSECSMCHTQQVFTIPAIGHIYSNNYEYDVENHWLVCSCGDKKDKVAHNYGNYTIDTSSTVTHGSEVRIYTCQDCNYVKREIVPLQGHTIGNNYQLDTTDNNYHLLKCSCGEVVERQTHTFNNGTITKQPTETTTGIKEFTCIYCNYKKYEDIPKLSPGISGDYSTEHNGYYSSLSNSLSGGLNGSFRKQLTKIIQPKDRVAYSAGLARELQKCDEDPVNPNNMIYFYTQASIKKNSANTWNREHCWPQSLSGGLYGTSGGGADMLHIRPTYNTTNSNRGNLRYGTVPVHTNTLVYEGYEYGWKNSSYFEPLDSVKGDCARIVLYMWVCYFADRGTPISNTAQSIDLMIQWSKLDPPSQIEKNRNSYVFTQSVQKNRNPFVDHPEWVDYIFA